MKRKLSSLKRQAVAVTAMFAPALAYAQMTLPAPKADVFGGTENKITEIAGFLSYAVQGGAVLFAVSCLIMSGNYMNRGDYGKGVGAIVGSALSGFAVFMVDKMR